LSRLPSEEEEEDEDLYPEERSSLLPFSPLVLVVCSSLVFAVPMFLAKEGSDGGEDQDDEGAAAVL
jgi:hypothetical protein